MKITGSYDLKTDIQTAWTLLNDPAVLEECIPGCRRLTQTSPDVYEAEMNLGIGMIRGSYTGSVRVVDSDPPNSYRLLVEGSGGAAGFVKGEGLVSLSEGGSPDTTRIDVEGESQVGGMVARVGQRMLGNVARTLLNQFFGCLSKKV